MMPDAPRDWCQRRYRRQVEPLSRLKWLGFELWQRKGLG